MLLRMVLGRAGTGKTTFCLQEMAAAQQMDDKQALLYIVPEQFSLQSEKALLEVTENGALTRAETLSFRRLSFRVFSEMGGFDKVVLEEVGRNVILRKILFDVKPQLAYFTSSMDKQGFIESLGGMLGELYQYEILPETLRQAAGAVSGNEGLRLKLHDLSIILNAYGAYLAEHNLSGEDALDLLADSLCHSALVRGAQVWIDGFKSFTPQEYRVLEQILRHADCVTVALTVDNAQNGYPDLKRQDAFFETKNTVNMLCRLAHDAAVPIAEAVGLSIPRRFDDAPALAFLESRFMGYRQEQYGGDAACVRLVQADNMYTEIHAAARTIVELTREKGLRYSEIGIVCASHEAYAKSVQAVFAPYGIPVFIDAKEDILSHPLAEYIRSALEIITSGWQYESVFRFLKTGMTDIPRADIDKLENYVLAYGIRFGRWQKEWEYGFDGAYERFDRTEMNALRERVLALLSPLTGKFTRSSKHEASTFCRVLYDFLAEGKALAVLERWMDEARAHGQNLLTQTHGQVWDGIADLLDKIYETLGNERMGTTDFARVLEAGFSAISLGLVPPSLDQVIVGDLRRSRLPEVKALLLLGATEGALPGNAPSDGVLTDEERRNLAKMGVRLAPDALSRAVEDHFAVYGVLTKPGMFLYVSCYISGLDGKAVFPSPVMHRLADLLPRADKRRAEACASDAMDEVTVASPTFDALAQALRSYIETGALADTYKDVYTFFRRSLTFNRVLSRLEARLVSRTRPEKLLRETVHKLYAGRILSSVTQLERYAQCPFSYFMRYNLRALERKVYEVESVQLGTLFHETLERYARKLAEKSLDWSDPDDEALTRLAEACVAEALAARGNEILRSTGQYRYFTERIKNIAVQSIRALTAHMRGSGFSVAALEAAFGADGADAVRVPLAQGKMELQGRVDRVDVLTLDDGAYVKLMDYKSGHKAFSLSELYYGLQLQLVMYIDAVIGHMKKQAGLKKVYPAAVLYFRLQNPVVEFDAALTEAEVRERLLASFQMTGLVLDSQAVIENLDEKLRPGMEESVRSQVVPVGLNKAKNEDDFLLGKSSKVISAEAFGRLMAFSMRKAAELGNDILSGNIAVWPCLYDKASGCRFCEYRAVCGFDAKQQAYRVLPKLGAEEAQQRVFADGDQ